MKEFQILYCSSFTVRANIMYSLYQLMNCFLYVLYDHPLQRYIFYFSATILHIMTTPWNNLEVFLPLFSFLLLGQPVCWQILSWR